MYEKKRFKYAVISSVFSDEAFFLHFPSKEK